MKITGLKYPPGTLVGVRCDDGVWRGGTVFAVEILMYKDAKPLVQWDVYIKNTPTKYRRWRSNDPELIKPASVVI